MLNMFKKIWQTGIETAPLTLEEAPKRYRGRLEMDLEKCDGCGDCVDLCPSGAISLIDQGSEYNLKISYTSCIYCGICEEACHANSIRLTNEYRLASKNKRDLDEIFEIETIPLKVKSGE